MSWFPFLAIVLQYVEQPIPEKNDSPPSFDGVLNRCKLKSLGLKPAEVFDLAENSGANSSSKRSLETSSNWGGSGLQLNWL